MIQKNNLERSKGKCPKSERIFHNTFYILQCRLSLLQHREAHAIVRLRLFHQIMFPVSLSSQLLEILK